MGNKCLYINLKTIIPGKSFDYLIKVGISQKSTRRAGIMRKVDISDPHILKSVYKTLLTNSDITSSIPHLTQLIDEFGELVPGLELANSTNTEFSKDDRQKIYPDNFYYLLEKISVALGNYAVISENSELLTCISFTRDCPVNSDSSEFLKKVKLILEFANHYLFALEKLGIKKHHLIEFEIEINSCEKYKKFRGKELNERVNAVIYRIDQLIESLRDKYPRFYHEYQISKLTPVKNNPFENLSVW